MLDILTAILYNEDMDLLGKKPLETPRTTAEVQFLSHCGRPARKPPLCCRRTWF